MAKTEIHSSDAPDAIGPYSQGIKLGNLVFTAGQIPLNKETGKLNPGDFKDRVNQVFENLNAVLKAAGTDLSNVVKFTVFMTDLTQFSVVNEVFGERLKGSIFPARSAVQVSALPLGVDIEIECIAECEHA